MSTRARDAVRGRAKSVARRIERRSTGRLGLLGYHSVSEPAVDPWHLAVSPRHFDAQVGVLREVGSVAAFGEAMRASWAGRVVRLRPTFVITFDDGYADNLRAALPVLERHDCPATVFIATGVLDTDVLWWDVLASVAFSPDVDLAALTGAAIDAGLLRASAPDSPDSTGYTGDTGDTGDEDADRRALHEALNRTCSALGARAALDAVIRLADATSHDVPALANRPLTTDELVELARHPLVTIGVHTVSHRRLTELSPSAAAAEMGDARDHLDQLLGRRARPLAYPYGNADRDVAASARRLGFEHAVTTKARFVRVGDDPLLLPRLDPRDVDRDDFAAWLDGRG